MKIIIERRSFDVTLGDQPHKEGQADFGIKMELPGEAKDSWMNPDYEE